MLYLIGDVPVLLLSLIGTSRLGLPLLGFRCRTAASWVTRAKEFELTRAGWFGNAVSWRRRALNLTASELSRRTVDLGYPISRGAIAKIESNLRSGKIDVAEVLVLAAALDIPPVFAAVSAVLHRRLSGQCFPASSRQKTSAVRWMSGQVPFLRSATCPGCTWNTATPICPTTESSWSRLCSAPRGARGSNFVGAPLTYTGRSR